MKNTLTLFLLIITQQIYAGQWAQEYKRAVQSMQPKEVISALENRSSYRDWQSDAQAVLFYAVQKNNVVTINFYEEEKIPLDASRHDGATALMVASYCGSLQSIEALVCAGANVNHVDATGWTPLLCAVDQQHIACVRVLLENGAQVAHINELGLSPLLSAADKGNTELISLLLAFGADTNQINEDGWSPFHCAVDSNRQACVIFLLNNGADKNVKNKQGKTALHMAVQKNNTAMVKLLLENSVAIDVQDVDGITPLMIAVFEQFDEVVDLLLPLSTINIPSQWGWTALHFACHVGNLAYVQKLLDAGAHADQKDHLGWMPRTVATAQHHTSIVQLLAEVGTQEPLRCKRTLDLCYKLP